MSTKVITGKNNHSSYLNANEPKTINGSKPKYSVSLIIPKDDIETVDKIKAAIELAYKEDKSKLKGNGKSVPALEILKTPLRDGELERPDGEAYQNAYFVNANSPYKPGVVDVNRLQIHVHIGSYLDKFAPAEKELRIVGKIVGNFIPIEQ
ncbi:DUF2815 family protein [Streptococcus cuniculipharyngis]|uniref:DUF2815 family protein n=1 Tax=Streptococcus cuniculipharyngis TaxID=1562651 RepID=A0A5C5SE47_9STRE|nr:DUF2815 family protein [Streptococcus cuniculipharyngis]